MSIEAMSLVLHHSRARGTDKVVLLGIANHDGDGGAWPTVETLAKYANVHERNVQRSVERLVELGELVVHVHGGGNDGRPKYLRPNRYDVVVGCPVTCDRSKNHKLRPLPTAQAELWTNPVAQTPPRSSEVAQTPPGEVAQTPPKPSMQPTNLTVSSSVTTPRETGGDTPPCTECAAPSLDVCARRQAKLRPADRHTYTPRPA